MKWPYPCDDFEHCDYIAYIDKSLEWHEIIETVSDNRWELLRSSYIITDVANHMKEPYVIEDVLGVKRLTIQRSDLYLFSAMVKLLVFASDVAAVYENRFSVSESLDDRNCRNQMDILNRYIGIAAELPDVSDSIIVFTDMMADIENAFVNARLLRDEYDNDTSQKCGNSVSIFNWVEVPYGVMDNIISVASAFKQDPVVISDVFSPDLRIDLSGLLQHLPVRTSEEPVVSCGDNGLEAAYGIYIKYFNDYVNPPLFEPDTEHFDLHHDINYRLSSGWRKWTVLDLF